jgi:hypothetical protein
MIIASTGLLGLEQRTIEISNQPISTTTAFDGVRSDLDNVGTLPLYITRGLQALQLPYPSGTTSNYAVQSFESHRDVSIGSQLTAIVDGMLAAVDCEIADIHVQYWYYAPPPQQPAFGSVPPVPYSSATIKSADCQFGIAFPYTNPGVDFVTMITPYNCGNKDTKGSDRLLVLYGTTLTVPSNITGLDNQNVSFVQSAQLVCKPYYNFGKVSVKLNNTQGSTQIVTDVTPVADSKPVVMSDISAWNIAETYLKIFLNAINTQNAFDALDPWGDLAFYFTILQDPAADFLDPWVLKTAFESYYSLLCTQIVSQLLVGPSADQITGLLHTSEGRLVVRTLSLRLLEGLLGFVTALGICMIFQLPTFSTVPRDPGSILGTLSLLSISQHTMRTLQNTGSLAIDAIKARIFAVEYGSSLETTQETPHFCVEAEVPPYYKMDAVPSQHTISEWWHPFFAGKWALGLCLLTQVGIIVALEVTWRKSQNHDGLADVTTDGYLPYTWTLLPAFVLSCIAMAYTSIGFHAKVFAPYSVLKSGRNTSHALLVNYLDKAEIHCMWSAAHLRQFAIFSITSAVILGSFLTIAVSGVFLVQEIPVQVPVDTSIADWFNSSDLSSGDVGNNPTDTSSLNAFVAGALVVEGNLSYPDWTYGEYVFPHIQISYQSLVDASYHQLKNVTSLQMKMPALRSKMDCGWYKSDKQLNASFMPITTCTTHDNSSTTCTTKIDYSNAVWNETLNPYCPGNGYLSAPVSTGVFGFVQNSYPGCQPTYTWGSTGVRKIDHITSLSCNNTMEQLDVDVTFTLPDFLIDPSIPPIADESTAKFFTLPDILVKGALFGGLPNFTAIQNMDNYFVTLTQGKDGFPLSELANSNFDDTVVARIKHLTGLFRAQEYNAQGRIPATFSMAARKLTGIAIDPHRTRLVQTQASTRIVQCLLGVMAVLAIFSHFAMNTRNLLPKNPCSIAGMASLLVDSEFMRNEALLSGVEKKSDREARKMGTFERQGFGLGWFDVPSGRHSIETSALGPVTPASTSTARYSIPRKPLPSTKRRFGIDVVGRKGDREEAIGLTTGLNIGVRTKLRN